MKSLALSLPLFLLSPALPIASATSPQVPPPSSSPGVTIPFHAEYQITYVAQSLDPLTGHLVTHAVTTSTGTLGVNSGVMTLDLDLATFAFTGVHDVVTPDGSTYHASFEGQFLDAIHAICAYDISGGTGRFAGAVGSGIVESAEWLDGTGNTSIATGTLTFGG